jgi:hypothetical protein
MFAERRTTRDPEDTKNHSVPSTGAEQTYSSPLKDTVTSFENTSSLSRFFISSKMLLSRTYRESSWTIYTPLESIRAVLPSGVIFFEVTISAMTPRAQSYCLRPEDTPKEVRKKDLDTKTSSTFLTSSTSRLKIPVFH